MYYSILVPDYLSVLVNKEQINKAVLKPLMTDSRITRIDEGVEIESLIELIKNSSVYASEAETLPTFKDAVKSVLKGECALFIDGSSKALAFNTSEWKARKVTEAKIESVVLGPQEAFVEDVEVNISLIRRRIKTPDLKMEKMEIGRLSKTSVIVAYIKGIADDGRVDEIRKRLNKIDTDVILDSGYISEFIQDNAFSPFPQMVVTERPDKSVGALAEGRRSLSLR